MRKRVGEFVPKAWVSKCHDPELEQIKTLMSFKKNDSSDAKGSNYNGVMSVNGKD